ncbi:MAG: hypothetical protein ACK5T6_09220, partial [Pirellula sp.]
ASLTRRTRLRVGGVCGLLVAHCVGRELARFAFFNSKNLRFCDRPSPHKVRGALEESLVPALQVQVRIQCNRELAYLTIKNEQESTANRRQEQ